MREGNEQTGNIQQLSTGYLQLASGTTAQRPTANNGMMRYNTDFAQFEFFAANAWSNAVTATSVAATYLPLAGGNVTGNLGVAGNLSMSAGSLSLTVGNVTMTSGNVILTSGKVELATGNATAPSLTFGSNLKAGAYYTTNAVSITADGSNTFVVQSNVATPSFLFNSIDGIALPSGTTADRPVTVTAGIHRWNTTLGGFDSYDGVNWDTHSTASLTGADSIASEPINFVYDTTRSKYLSQATMSQYYIATTVATNDFITWDSIFSSDVGLIMPYNGCITGWGVYITNINTCARNVSVYVGATENTGQFLIGGTGTNTGAYSLTKTNANLNFSAGNNIRVQMRFAAGTTGHGWTNMNLIMYYKWRI
jgi:hypothetical protein